MTGGSEGSPGSGESLRRGSAGEREETGGGRRFLQLNGERIILKGAQDWCAACLERENLFYE